MSKKHLLKGSIIIITFTILSKILGFLRETLVAANFGATYDADIFNFSMGLVGLLLGSIGSGLATTFIPMLTEAIETKSKRMRNRFVSNVINVTLLVVFVLLLFGLIFTKYIVMAFAPGFIGNEKVFLDAVNITRIMFFSMIFIGLQNIFTGIHQSHNRFTVPAAVGFVMNGVYIFYLIFFAKKYGIYGLAIASVISYFLQLLIYIPEYKRLGYKYRFILDFKDEDLRRMFKLMLPVLIGASISQINFLVDRQLATLVGEGSIAVLNYANKLNTFIYGIFAVAISTVIYPTLATYSAQDNIDGYKNAVVRAVNMVMFIMIPATFGMMVLRQPFVVAAFQRGAFTKEASTITAMALFFYSPGMIFIGIRDIINRAFYSVKDTKTPMINGIAGVVLNIILNLLLVKYIGVSGLALATSISITVTTVLLIRSLNKRVKDVGTGKMLSAFIKITVSSLVMSIVVLLMNKAIIAKLGLNFKGSIISIFSCALVGALIYIVGIYILKLDEFMYAVNLAKRKLRCQPPEN
ncbi:murein biosynthesis integral membrane protein MurJ [Fonticella tunisiensis]|uniref:Probable lipid II flippase MurJ n=1 Tax=Fonticella tunisiensis TaxID=1096341 RepID=A0A4R7KDD1_9CLOT|nr:murein biosynthesis integral membrane protein MurJ [Fonticella tunisiensis]TDT51975.1 putative peptidoglycan lipid II flippase [Fonticella tunisiensis]